MDAHGPRQPRHRCRVHLVRLRDAWRVSRVTSTDKTPPKFHPKANQADYWMARAVMAEAEVVRLRDRLENRTALKLGFCDETGKLTEKGWAHFREQTAGTGMVLLTAEEAERLKWQSSE
jgi:hypothetical protein